MMQNDLGRVIAKNFRIVKKLGEGAFGQIFLGVNIKNESEVAIKIEACGNNKHQQLLSESKMLAILSEHDPSLEIGIPNVYFTSSEEKYNVMVMDLLGPSLENLFSLCQKKFSLKTSVLLGLQMIDLIKYVHSKGILHRDVKPDNFLIGTKKKASRVFIIDFGLAKRYKTKQGQHIPYRDNKNLTGTARYASINTHLGIEQGRRDDLESMVYVLIYFLRGNLPWQNLKAANKKEKYERITEKKLATPMSVLCGGLPREVEEMLLYVRSLHFEHEPDYQFLTDKLKSIADREQIKPDGNYDWVIKPKLKKEESKQLLSQAIRT